MNKLLLFLLLFFPVLLTAQTDKKKSVVQTAGFSLAAGKTISPSLYYSHNWQLGKKKRFEIGLGARYTGLLGKNLNYITAPASITSGKTGPGVLFTENIEANIDTLTLAKPQTHSVNLAIDLGYRISPRFYAGFTIDLLGFSFGKKNNDGRYIRNASATTGVVARPTGFNALLISDNDRGSLYSALYLRCQLNERWFLQGGAAYIFSEYTTQTEVQQQPSPNDRFRYKGISPFIGISRLLR